DAGRGRAMGFAYLGIGVGGALVPLIAHALEVRFGWHTALQLLGVLMIAIALPLIWVVREAPAFADATDAASLTARQARSGNAGTHAPVGAAPIAAVGSRPRIWTDWTFPLLL